MSPVLPFLGAASAITQGASALAQPDKTLTPKSPQSPQLPQQISGLNYNPTSPQMISQPGSSGGGFAPNQNLLSLLGSFNKGN